MSEVMIEIDGVMWCVPHSGIVDECSGRLDGDGDGEPCCDMADAANEDDPCRIVTLYVSADEVQP